MPCFKAFSEQQGISFNIICQTKQKCQKESRSKVSFSVFLGFSLKVILKLQCYAVRWRHLRDRRPRDCSVERESRAWRHLSPKRRGRMLLWEKSNLKSQRSHPSTLLVSDRNIIRWSLQPSYLSYQCRLIQHLHGVRHNLQFNRIYIALLDSHEEEVDTFLLLYSSVPRCSGLTAFLTSH